MAQTGFAKTIQIGLETLACYELVLAVYLLGKAIGVAYIVEDREKDDKQLLVKVDPALLVDGIEIDGLPLLYDGTGGSDSATPVDFVQSAMLVLHDKEEETLVVTVELQE